jgi:hypothetical protein
MRLQPDWLGELVSICVSDDWRGAQTELTWGEVSPMFRRLLPELAQSEDADGYSSLEVRACREGIEWLSTNHPAEFGALCWQFWDWKRKHLTRAENHDELLQRAGKLLADYVDRACG